MMRLAKPNGQKFVENIWTPYVKIYRQESDSEGSKHPERGMYISKAEREKIKDAVVEIIRSIIMPGLEKKFKQLSINTQPKRRFGFFSKEAASGIQVDSKVFSKGFITNSRIKLIGNSDMQETWRFCFRIM